MIAAKHARRHCHLDRCTVITDDLGLELKDATIEALGQAAKVSVDKDSTVIVEGSGNPEAIANRVAVIKSQIELQPLNLTVKNYKNVWPNCLVVLPLIKGRCCNRNRIERNETSYRRCP